MLSVKKIGAKQFHNGNRLNGDGGNNRAKYGLFNGSIQVGWVSMPYQGFWEVYGNDNKRYVERSFRSLKDVREWAAKN